MVNAGQDGLNEKPARSYFMEERAALEVIARTNGLKRMMEMVSGEKPLGRRKLPREPMLRAFIIARLRGIPTIKGTVRELSDNPAMCDLCGFDVIDSTGSLPVYRIPSRRTFGRLFKELQRPEFLKLLEECMAEFTSRQYESLPDFGKHIAIDSTTIRSNCGLWSGTDPEASNGRKHDVKTENETDMVLGYKYHVITDSRGYFITGIVTTGKKNDSPILPDLMEKARGMLGEKFAPESASADGGYDSKANHELLHSNGVAPLIPMRKMPKSELRRGRYTDDGVPVCDGLEMEYVCTDIKTGRRLYRCPEDNHIPKGQMLPCAGEVEVDPKEDIRLFGGAIRRGSPEYKEKYRGRYGVERLFAWWKQRCALERHYFRGKANIELHTMLTALAYQGRQTARLSGAAADRAA